LPVEIAHDLPGDEWRRVQRAEGYSHVIVNGQVTWEGDRFTGATPGKVLRHGVSA
jgi:N-acyl-D-aspartate/D-glutamate deacylase